MHSCIGDLLVHPIELRGKYQGSATETGKLWITVDVWEISAA